jgi:polysaccharide deacetylase family protein (PEP-CTERM system associated)
MKDMLDRQHPGNVFTVDLEDWYQGLTSTNSREQLWPSLEERVVEATRSLLSLLAQYNVRATFFVLGKVAEQHPGLIEEVAAAGHEIGVHGYMHRFVNRLTPAEFARELEQGSEAVQRITGTVPLGHRAPYFSIDGGSLWSLDVLQEQGFKYDSSFFPVRNMLYGYAGAPRAPHRVGPLPEQGSQQGRQRQGDQRLVEFPVSTLRVGRHIIPFAGGFYMRSWPYVLIRSAIHRVRREGLPAILYLHPWELDLDQPRPKVTMRERVTHYHGRRSLRGKLEKLLSEFQFGPLCGLLDAS